MAKTNPETKTTAEVPTYNAAVKTFKQSVTDEETGLVVKNLYYLKITRGNITTQINVGEKTYTQVKTLTEEEPKKEA